VPGLLWRLATPAVSRAARQGRRLPPVSPECAFLAPAPQPHRNSNLTYQETMSRHPEFVSTDERVASSGAHDRYVLLLLSKLSEYWG